MDEYKELEHRMDNVKVPLWHKTNLTVAEAAAYSGIGVKKLKQLSDDEDCPFVL